MITSTYFHSNGKLLLTGEYLILHGAKSLATPVAAGQSLMLLPSEQTDQIHWITQYQGNPALELRLSPQLDILQANPPSFDSGFLMQLLRAADRLQPGKLSTLKGKTLVSNLEFAPDWGLGSSSSLISNIARLFEINPFDLHFKVSKGSGYDIACAQSKQAILYQLNGQRPDIQEVDYNPAFKDELYLVYLGQKQDSAKEVSRFMTSNQISTEDIHTVGELTEAFLEAGSSHELSRVVREHEKLLAHHLGMKPIQDQYFSSFDGTIKSLGAWGGDFALIITKNDKKKVNEYFAAKKLQYLFSFDELIHGRFGR